MDFCFRETGSNPLIVYATAFGSIVGLDLRCNTPAFRLENDLHEGLQTSIAMSSDQCWMVNGTSSGVISCWDLRFQIPIGKKMLTYIPILLVNANYLKIGPFFQSNVRTQLSQESANWPYQSPEKFWQQCKATMRLAFGIWRANFVNW